MNRPYKPGVKRKSKSVPAWHFLVSGTGAKGAKDATDGADAVSGTGGDVSTTGNVPEMPWAPHRCLGCQASSLFSWAARQEAREEV